MSQQLQIAILQVMNELAEKKNHALKWITTGGGTNNETGEGTGRHIQLDTTTGVITKGYGAGKSLKEAFAPKTERQKIGRKFSEAGAAKYGGSERDYRNLGVTKGQADSFAAEYLKSGNIPEGHLREVISKNDLTLKQNNATLSSTSHVEADNKNSEGSKMLSEKQELESLIQEKQDKLASSDVKFHSAIKNKITELQSKLEVINAAEKQKNDFAKKSTSKGFNQNIQHREDGTFAVSIPFALKDKFKKEFSSAKFDSKTKEWTVGSRSGEKLNAWVNEHLEDIEDSKANKAAFAEKVAEMHTLSGKTFDVKDEIKSKFGGVFKDGSWHVPAEHREAAQAFVNESNAKAKNDRAMKKDAHYQEITRKPTSEEQKSIDAWLSKNYADEDSLMDDEFKYAVQTGNWHKKEQNDGVFAK
jgi:hypothetical protein